MEIYTLSWTDGGGAEHVSEYTDRLKAYKAAKWLRDGGAPQVDVAVRIADKEDKEAETVAS